MFLKISPHRGLTHFGRGGKLSLRYIGSFDIIERIGEVTYHLALPLRLSSVHNVFHVSMLKKYEPDLLHVLECPLFRLALPLVFGKVCTLTPHAWYYEITLGARSQLGKERMR